MLERQVRESGMWCERENRAREAKPIRKAKGNTKACSNAKRAVRGDVRRVRLVAGSVSG